MKLDRDKVIRAREMVGYGIETVAEEAGVAKNSVLRAEHGGDIRPSTARKIAAALGVRVADLIGESETLKAASRSAYEPSLFNGFEDERRSPTDQEIRSLSRWLAYVEQRLDEKDLSAAEIDHALDAVGAFAIRNAPGEYPDQTFNRFMRVTRGLLEEAKAFSALQAKAAELEAEMPQAESTQEQRAS